METENKLSNKIENEAIHEVDETNLQRELKQMSKEVEKSMSEFLNHQRLRKHCLESKSKNFRKTL